MTVSRAAAALVASVVLAGVAGACTDDGMEITATFTDVGDLQARHSVQVADVRVGEIKGIRLTDDFEAEVTMRIDGDAKLPKDSIALLRTTSLLGEKFVELRPNNAPDEGPYLRDGDEVAATGEAPELEFVAQEAVEVLGSVVATDVATIIEGGAVSFAGRGGELQSLLTDLASISATFASRTDEIGRIIDGLDATMATLADGSGELATLFTNLAETTRVLADNRHRALAALEQLSRLARVQDEVLRTYRADIERQIRQADAVVAIAAGQATEVGLLIDWLNRFVDGLPSVVPGDFTQVYGWFIPADQDPRPTGPAGDNP